MSSTQEQDQPLGLTVHNLPNTKASGAASASAVNSRPGRWKMLLILLVCAAPVLASYTAYYWLRPEGRRNFGDLIDPQRPMPALMATRLDGQAVPLLSLKAQWLLVSVAGGACDAMCQQNLYFQRQLREGLGKNKDRMDWVWLVTDTAPIPDSIRPALKGATVLRISQAELAQWLQPGEGQDLAAHLYVVDPMGNWMMRFPAGVSMETAPKFKRDLEQLMRGSAGWDQAGR